MDTMTTAVVKPSPDNNQATERSPKVLKTRAEGLTDLATQSLKQILEQQTGNHISRTEEATIRLAVRSIIKAAVATTHYHEASS